ncbi:MAG: serine protease [Acholeplasmataceae bacterium]
MKRVFLFVLFAAILSLTACDNEEHYEELLSDYEAHLEDQRAAYQRMNRYLNELSSDVVSSAVAIYSFGETTQSGSGVIFEQDENYYYMLTNYHVAYQRFPRSPAYRVHDHLGNSYDASLVYRDSDYDLAVLQFRKGRTELEPIDFAEDDLAAGEHVAIIGFPERQINAITMGRVNGYERIEISDVDADIVSIDFDVMSMDAPVKGGSSGSLVVNERYELSGILFAGTISGSDFTESYALPLGEVLSFIADYEETLESGDDDA